MEEKYQIIYEFLDGELPIEREGELFALLATDQEARNELKSILAIKDAVRTDSVAFVPPIKSTNKIFTTLGFTAPGAIATNVAVSKFQLIKNWLSSQSKFIATGVASAIATALLMLWLIPKEQTISTNQNIQQSNQNIPKVESIIVPEVKEKIVYKYIPVDKNKSNQELTNNNEMASINFYGSTSPINDFETRIPINKTEFYPINIDFSSLLPDNLLDIEKKRKLSLEIKGLSHSSDIREKVRPANEQFLNNTSLSIVYEYNPELSFGLNYTRENFYQKFEGYENGQLYQYEQKPNFETFSIIARYSPDILKFEYAVPFAQISVGGNKVGMVGRFGAGVDIPLTNRYSITAGYDFSNMYYTHQNKWFSSSKRGFELGAKIKF